LHDFWRWSVSDLVSNATRGRLAEFIVANALGISTTAVVRDEWSPFDLQTPEGVKVEVKSAAYIQSWYQSKLSSISFRTPKTHAFDPETNQHDIEAKWQADVYVFAVLVHEDKKTIDPAEPRSMAILCRRDRNVRGTRSQPIWDNPSYAQESGQTGVLRRTPR
jgi:hypothetical protein